MKHTHRWIEDSYLKPLNLTDKEKILVCTVCHKKRLKWPRHAKGTGKFTTTLAGWTPYDSAFSLGLF